MVGKINNISTMAKKILVIDDDKIYLEDLAFLLSDQYDITTASDSRRGIELLNKTKFDCVVLDLDMPAYYADEDDMEGMEVLKKIREKWNKRNMPVIIVSKMDTEEIQVLCSNLGADDFIKKPLSINKLKESINNKIKGT